MNSKVKQKWLDALRSGEYQQGDGCLYNGSRYCCLGVLTDLYIQEFDDKEWEPLDLEYSSEYDLKGGQMSKSEIHADPLRGQFLSQEVTDWAGLSDADPIVNNGGINESLSEANDCGYSFDEIADLIEGNL